MFGSFRGAVTAIGSVEAARDADDAQLAALRASARAQRDDGRERGERNSGEGDAAHLGYFFSRTRRSSSSLPGSRIASTWSPTWSSVSESGISAWPPRMTEISRDPLGQLEAGDALAGRRRALVDLHLDDLEVLLAQLEQVDQLVLGHLVLDQGHDRLRRAHGRRDPEQVEVRLVARVVDARDHLRDAVVLARHLADDHVVLVVSRDGDDEVRRPRDPGPLEHEDLGRVADDRGVLELLLEVGEAVAPLLDDRHLVADPAQRARDVRADLAAAGDEDEHQDAAAGARSGLTAHDFTASDSTSIAVDVGDTVRRPRVA